MMTFRFYINVAFHIFSVSLILVGSQFVSHPLENRQLDYHQLYRLLTDKGGEIDSYGDKHLKPFKKYLPKQGKISFILDAPYDPFNKVSHNFRVARSNLVPLFITSKPTEEIAMIVCSSDLIANKRLQEINYEWIVKLRPGQGVARKK